MHNLTLHNDVTEVPLLFEWVETLGEQCGLEGPELFGLNLALEEAVVNVMSYAYPGQNNMPIWLEAKEGDGMVTFTLSDEGVPFDPLQKETPDLDLSVEERPIGGLGIFLVQQYMDKVEYERIGTRNVLTMIYKTKTC